MYRNGIYQSGYSSGAHGDLRPRKSIDGFGGSPTDGEAGFEHYRGSEDKLQSSQLYDDPHGYHLGEANFAHLQKQLHEKAMEDHARQRHRSSHKPDPNLEAENHLTEPYFTEDDSYSFSYSDNSSTSDSLKTPSDHDSPSTHSPAASPFQKALREARHFAGGIIHHPSESTKHFSILRHSHGLVFYQGTSTSIAISIFADTELPPNRSIWLKPKNWTAPSKNRATFKQQTQSLLNLTPTASIAADQASPSDERAWQRDISEFKKRTRKSRRRNHLLRETLVIRIPPDTGDGYFQLLLCGNPQEETLCISPVFRILSLGLNMGAISGANWATLPLEVGAIALSMRARALIGAVVLPAKLAVKSKADPLMPPHADKARMAGKLAYGATGVSDRVNREIGEWNHGYQEQRGDIMREVGKIDDDYENGPKMPFPISFHGVCAVGDGECHVLPRIKLEDVPENAIYRLTGYYFGWCAFTSQNPGKHSKNTHHHRAPHWVQAIIIVNPISIDNLSHVNISQANKKEIHIQLLSSRRPPPPNSSISVQVMGHLRPWDAELETLLASDLQSGEEVAQETVVINEMSDISLTRTILGEEAWGPADEGMGGGEKEKEQLHGMERVKREYTEKRLVVQKGIDRLPLERVGVRMPLDRLKEQAVVLNGFCIRR